MSRPIASIAQPPPQCGQCGHVSTRTEPVHRYRERISGDRLRETWQCQDLVMCWARIDQQHGGLSIAVKQQLASRQQRGRMTETYELFCSLCGDPFDVPAYVWRLWNDWPSLVCPDCQTRIEEQPGRYPARRQTGACELPS